MEITLAQIAEHAGPFATAILGVYAGIKAKLASLDKENQSLKKRVKELEERYEDLKETTDDRAKGEVAGWQEINRTLGQIEGFLEATEGRPPRPQQRPPSRPEWPTPSSLLTPPKRR